MIVTFCGHSSFVATKEAERKMLLYLNTISGDVDFYLGGYGAFDAFAYNCGKKYKATHKSSKLIFVTPYLTESYQKNKLNYLMRFYDEILYPEIENIPPKHAIIHRNRYMIERSDIVIAYICHTFGGAYKTFKFATQKKKPIFNLADNLK